MLSRTAEYALRAMVALCNHGGGGPLLAREIAQMTNIPSNYLSKILRLLVRAGLLSSGRGRGGGFRLNCEPQSVTAYSIVENFDDVAGQRRCFLGSGICSAETACAVHDQWEHLWSGYEEFLKNTKLNQLAAQQAHGGGSQRSAARRLRHFVA